MAEFDDYYVRDAWRYGLQTITGAIMGYGRHVPAAIFQAWFRLIPVGAAVTATSSQSE